jgi:IS5 family transposase
MGIEKMLRLLFLQQWYGLTDVALEDTIYDSQAMRNFVSIDLGREAVPDATTLLKFRHLLEKHELTRRLFDEVNALLSEDQLLMLEGTLVDATIIPAPAGLRTFGPNSRQKKRYQNSAKISAFFWHFSA